MMLPLLSALGGDGGNEKAPKHFGALNIIITIIVMTLQTPISACMPPPILILLLHSIANM
jgi:hypothetical protein